MKDLNTNLLRYDQRQQLQSEVDNADNMLKHAKADEVGQVMASKARIMKQLESLSPEPLTAKEKDTLGNLEKKLRARITENMPTQEVMRKNPAGAVDWHMRWEKHNKKAIRIWKNIRVQLNPDNSDRDLANIERYRPSGAVDRLRGDAQIPGVISYHNISDEQWPFAPPQNTAAEQAKRVYTEEQAEKEVNSALEELDQAEIVEVEEKVEKVSPEQRAELLNRLTKAREALAKKRAEERQVQETLEAVPDVAVS